jgi:hypothetical protein
VANPTTNYGFVLPTSSDLVTDLPADFDVALQGVDTRLKALNPATTLGDTDYRSATSNTNTRLPIGTAGQVLTVSGGVPAWVTPAGGSGTIKQVVTGTYNTLTTTTSSSQVDTNLSLSITPTANTSKILILIGQSFGYLQSLTGQGGVIATLYRDSTEINGEVTMAFANHTTSSGSNSTLYLRSGFWYYDSPATTSATTYKTMFSQRNTSTAYANRDGASFITLMEIGA